MFDSIFSKKPVISTAGAAHEARLQKIIARDELSGLAAERSELRARFDEAVANGDESAIEEVGNEILFLEDNIYHTRANIGTISNMEYSAKQALALQNGQRVLQAVHGTTRMSAGSVPPLDNTARMAAELRVMNEDNAKTQRAFTQIHRGNQGTDRARRLQDMVASSVATRSAPTQGEPVPNSRKRG